MDTEKRVHYRIPLNKYVCYELIKSMRSYDKKVYYDGNCLNISQGGLCILTDFYLMKGDILKLLVPQNNLNLANPLFAKVIWSRYEKGSYRAGLKFIKIMEDR